MENKINESIKQANKRMSFIDFMNTTHAVNRWHILMVMIGGAFGGALLAICFMMFGFGF